MNVIILLFIMLEGDPSFGISWKFQPRNSDHDQDFKIIGLTIPSYGTEEH